MVPHPLRGDRGKLDQNLLLAVVPGEVACGVPVHPRVGPAWNGLVPGVNADDGQMGTQLRPASAGGAGAQVRLGGLGQVLLIPVYAGPALQVLKQDGHQQHAYRHTRHDRNASTHSRHPLISSLWVTVFTYSVPPRAYRASEMSTSF